MYLDPTDDTMTTQPAYGYLNVEWELLPVPPPAR
jgi:hypothetical protein